MENCPSINLSFSEGTWSAHPAPPEEAEGVGEVVHDLGELVLGQGAVRLLRHRYPRKPHVTLTKQSPVSETRSYVHHDIVTDEPEDSRLRRGGLEGEGRDTPGTNRYCLILTPSSVRGVTGD